MGQHATEWPFRSLSQKDFGVDVVNVQTFDFCVPIGAQLPLTFDVRLPQVDFLSLFVWGVALTACRKLPVFRLAKA
jgi:hypothetical protein